MRKISLIAVLLGVGISCVADEFRNFKSADGKQIRGKVIRVDGRKKTVSIKRDSGKSATVPIAVFSEEDQSYIKDWLKAQEFLSNSTLRVTVQKKKEQMSEKGTKLKRPKYLSFYEIQCLNKSGTNLDSIKVEYCQYTVTELSKGRESVAVSYDSKYDVELETGSNFSWETSKIKLYRHYSLQTDRSTDFYGRNTSDTSYNKESEEEVEGIWVRLTYTTSQGNTFTRDILEPDVVGEKFSWDPRG